MLTSTENISLIEGNNFSGRSDYLRTVTSFNESETSDAKNVFIGAVPRNYISGLSTTSAFELKLHSKNENVSHNNSVNVFLKEIGFDHLLNHDPFKLSGGEQTILTVASAMLLAPSTLAIDCTLEQLNEQWKNPLINLFRMNKEINYLIADNRTEEYSNLIKRIRISDIDKRVDDEKIKFRDISIPDALPDIIKKNIANKFEIRNLSFAYQKNKPVLKDISFNLETGKIYFLEGMNGAGKSTLAKILTGVLKPEKNTSFFMDGRKVNPYEHPGKIFGYCYQNPDEQLFENTILKELNPLNNIPSVYLNYLIAAFDFKDVLKMHPMDLPLVMRRRLSIAATLAQDRPFYILDEPNLLLDNENINVLSKLLSSLVKCGKTFILITHSEIFKTLFSIKENLSLHNGYLKY